MFQNESKAKDLIDKRNSLVHKIFQTRKDIISTDEKAKALHEQMMKIAKELSFLVENKKVMRNLN